MKKHNAMPLADLIDMAEEQDINLVACTMTMDLLGLQKAELRESIQYAGVAAYLADAEDGNVNLFIREEDFITKIMFKLTSKHFYTNL